MIAAAPTISEAAAPAFSRGQALMLAKRPAEAAQEFETVTKANPEFAPAWYELAAARRKAGQCVLAIPAYRRYAQMTPGEPEPYYGLGICLKQVGQLASAVQALRRYVEIEKRPERQRWVIHARAVLQEIENGAGAPPTGDAVDI
jgi:Flp pilus assembly protein TadD